MKTSARMWLLVGISALSAAACEPGASELRLGQAGDNVGVGVEADGDACSFTQGGWGSSCSGQNVGCLRDSGFAQVFPEGLTVGVYLPLHLESAAAVEATLPLSGPVSNSPNSTLYGQMTALKLNVGFSEAGFFGAATALSSAVVVGGPYDGMTAPELLAYAESIDPTTASGNLVSALAAFNEGFLTCDPGSFPPPPSDDGDNDDDGVPGATDCDDGNALIGALLYENDFSAASQYFATGPKLTDPWAYANGFVSNTEGGQQGLLGNPEAWTNTVTWLTVSAHGSESNCASLKNCEPERFRAGVLARATIDGDQDEGYRGYRCAVAANSPIDCFSPGPFVQIGAFLDGAEDEYNSECSGGCPPNPTFDELDRENRSIQTNVLAGDAAVLTFWVVGDQLRCNFDGRNGEHIETSATDSRLASGGTGLSTLNAFGDFDHIKVCQALGTP
jgi:hypothetical protein